MQIVITLPRNRCNPGTLALASEAATLLSCPCYGKSDSADAAKVGNPTRDPFRRNGDAPTGTYSGVFEPRAMQPERTWGKWPPIRLNPIGGDGLTALHNGRKLLHIHGGHLNKCGRLAETGFGVRVEDRHVNELHYLLSQAGLTEIPIEITEA